MKEFLSKLEGRYSEKVLLRAMLYGMRYDDQKMIEALEETEQEIYHGRERSCKECSSHCYRVCGNCHSYQRNLVKAVLPQFPILDLSETPMVQTSFETINIGDGCNKKLEARDYNNVPCSDWQNCSGVCKKFKWKEKNCGNCAYHIRDCRETDVRDKHHELQKHLGYPIIVRYCELSHREIDVEDYCGKWE